MHHSSRRNRHSTRRAVLASGLLAASVLLSGVSGAVTPSFAQGESAQWAPMTIDQALVLAQTSGDNLLIDVWSSHCGQCEQMDIDVWSTPDGAAITEGVIPLKISSDTYDLRRRWPITGLPALLLIDPEGNEIDRVVGYDNRDQFIADAHELRMGIDPLPALEADLSAKPTSLPVMYELLETYYYRKMEGEAEAMLEKIIEHDPRNAAGFSEKALRMAAKYHAYFTHDAGRSQHYWRRLAEEFPTSSGVGGAIKAVLDHHRSSGTMNQWVDWACDLTNDNPSEGRLQSSVAMFALRSGIGDTCLAEAARRAHRLNANNFFNMDSVATVLESR